MLASSDGISGIVEIGVCLPTRTEVTVLDCRRVVVHVISGEVVGTAVSVRDVKPPDMVMGEVPLEVLLSV